MLVCESSSDVLVLSCAIVISYWLYILFVFERGTLFPESVTFYFLFFFYLKHRLKVFFKLELEDVNGPSV